MNPAVKHRISVPFTFETYPRRNHGRMLQDSRREDIRMNRRILTCTMIFLLAVAAGCKKQSNDQEAIRATIDKHLNARADLNLSAMDREVKQISVNGDHATAQVEFRLKQGNASMQVEYALDRQGGEWTITNSQPAGGKNPHSGGMPPPPTAPDSGGNSMPQGHPPVN
jgi:hypothetical protein